MLERVRIIADYQFGKGVGEKLFPDGVRFMLSRTGRIRQVIEGDKRIATIRANDGFLILSAYGGQKLHDVLPFPRRRVIMNDDAAPFVAKGKTAFCKFIVDCDPEIRALEEILLVDKDDQFTGDRPGAAVRRRDEGVQARHRRERALRRQRQRDGGRAI